MGQYEDLLSLVELDDNRCRSREVRTSSGTSIRFRQRLLNGRRIAPCPRRSSTRNWKLRELIVSDLGLLDSGNSENKIN